MIIRSIQGSILYKSNKISFKTALEEAVKAGIDLSHGNFRGQKLYEAKLDGIIAPGACLWGTDCRGADIAGGNLRDADLRNTDLKDACLAETDMEGANFSGAYFSNTILRHCNIAGSIFSCPSLFSCDLSGTQSLNRVVYCHRGEISVPLEKPPIVIGGFANRMVIFGDKVLWGEAILGRGSANDDFLKNLKEVKATIDRFL